MGARVVEERPDPPVIQRGERVVVHEPGITDRAGVVRSVKYSRASGWYVEVEYDVDGMTWVVPASMVVPEP